MTPATIVWFERLIFSTLVLGAIQSGITWDATVGLAATVSAHPVAFVAVTQLVSLALVAGLTLLISRRRSRVAQWIAIALFVVGLPAFIGLVASGQFNGVLVISAAQVAVQIFALGLLFTPSARAWMRGESSDARYFE